MWCLFFFNDTATTEIYTLSLHDALPISEFLELPSLAPLGLLDLSTCVGYRYDLIQVDRRSEEHTSGLQSHSDIVCRLLLGKTKEIRLTALTTCSLSTSRSPSLYGCSELR